jgi:hypothetical protein
MLNTPTGTPPAPAKGIEELMAGPEMDALVAERVMGWHRVLGSFAGTHRWHPDAVSLAAPIPADWPIRPTTDEVTYFGGIPAYSTDSTVTWSVVQRMRELGHGVAISDGDHCWHVRFGSRFDGVAKTFELAVCRAAIAAVGSTPHPVGR